MHYYVVQVRTGMEEVFANNDKKINSDRYKQYSIIFPQRLLKIRRKGKTYKEKAPVFKGYVFIETDEFNNKVYNSIKNIKGFYRFLPDNEEPVALYGRDLDILNHFLGFGGVADVSLVTFDENDKIKVLEGPLKGLEGKIIKVNKRKGRAKILMDAYNNSFTADLAFEILNHSNKDRTGSKNDDS